MGKEGKNESKNLLDKPPSSSPLPSIQNHPLPFPPPPPLPPYPARQLSSVTGYITIIPRARVGYEVIK